MQAVHAGHTLVALTLASACLLGACATSSAPAEPVPTTELPQGWREGSPTAFERLLADAFPGEPVRLSDPALGELADALGADPATAVRAAVLLGRSGDPAAAEALLLRLERRVLGPERASDAGDVVAASALTSSARDDLTERLVDLAAGPQPHPDLEVRVECARTALRLGEDAPVPFLLSVLRIGTPEGRAEGTFWPAPARSAWARERAAEVLAWRAETDNRYSADASLADREAEAGRLALLLEAAGIAAR